jgi:hypothetical protein
MEHLGAPVFIDRVFETVVEKEVEVVVEKAIYVDRFVEVEVLREGAEKPPPIFRAGQSVHQWRAAWMAGAYEAPKGLEGKSARPAWYSASVYCGNNSVSKHAAMPECQE